MSKTYNGACMALPERDEDLFEQINAKTAKRRAESERRRAEKAALDAEYVQVNKHLNINSVLFYAAMVIVAVASLLLGRMM